MSEKTVLAIIYFFNQSGSPPFPIDMKYKKKKFTKYEDSIQWKNSLFEKYSKKHDNYTIQIELELV